MVQIIDNKTLESLKKTISRIGDNLENFYIDHLLDKENKEALRKLDKQVKESEQMSKDFKRVNDNLKKTFETNPKVLHDLRDKRP